MKPQSKQPTVETLNHTRTSYSSGWPERSSSSHRSLRTSGCSTSGLNQPARLSLRSLSLSPLPSLAPHNPESDRGVGGLKPSPHQTFVSSREPICAAGCLGGAGKCVSKVRCGLDKWSESGRKAALHQPRRVAGRIRREAASEKSGSLWRRGLWPWELYAGLCRIARDVGEARRSHSASLLFCAFSSLAPASAWQTA